MPVAPLAWLHLTGRQCTVEACTAVIQGKSYLLREDGQDVHSLPLYRAVGRRRAVQAGGEVNAGHQLQAVVDVEHAVSCREHVAAPYQRARALQLPAHRVPCQAGDMQPNLH